MLTWSSNFFFFFFRKILHIKCEVQKKNDYCWQRSTKIQALFAYSIGTTGCRCRYTGEVEWIECRLPLLETKLDRLCKTLLRMFVFRLAKNLIYVLLWAWIYHVLMSFVKRFKNNTKSKILLLFSTLILFLLGNVRNRGGNSINEKGCVEKKNL